MQKIIQKIVRFINRKTLFPFILNDWKKIGDPFIISEFINTGYFRKNLKPSEPNLKEIRNIIVIAPHQDDEAIGCGGLLLKLKDQANIKVIFITNGEQSNLDGGKDESVRIRNSEAIKALKYINGEAIFLNLPNESLKIGEEEILRLTNELSKYKPDLLLVPWIFDRPYKHRIISYILYKSFLNLDSYKSIPLWNYQVHNVVLPNVVIDITNYITEKNKMINEYPSQITEKSPYDHYIIGMNQWNGQYLSNRRGYAEIYFALPVSDYINLFVEIIEPNHNLYLDK